MRIQHNICNLRHQYGNTQALTAQKLGISSTSYAKLKQGNKKLTHTFDNLLIFCH